MAAPAGSQHRCVFVGNIPYDATEEQLIQICEEVGPVVSFRLVLDRETGKPKGYGFCEYKDEETALSARRNLQGYEINGRQLRVDFAENDKNAERNREQGRGGPGLATSADAQNQFGGTPSVDPTMLLPVGLPSAVNAANLMAGALRGAQTAYLPNAVQGQSEIGTDPLTRYLSGISRHQLNEIMSEMKTLATQNRALAQQLLLDSPQLLKALFQALIMMGMVSPQMMQVANPRKSSSSVLPGSLPVGQLSSQKEVLVGTLTKPPEYQVPITAQNAGVLHQGILPIQQVNFQHQNLLHKVTPQDNLLHGTVMPSVPSVWPQSQGSLPVQSAPLPPEQSISQSQLPPIDVHRRPVALANLGHHPQFSLPSTTLQQSLVPTRISQIGTSSGVIPPKKEDPAPSNLLTSTRDTAIRSQSLGKKTEQTGTLGHGHSVTLQRLEDRTPAPQVVNSSIPTINNPSIQALGAGVSSRSQTIGDNAVQHSQKQILELSNEVESALLQQVLSLTPEQLSSLPLDQQQQVLQLQQLLSASK